MAVNLSPVGGVAAQFFTNNGVPLAGGKIFTYLAGTTTPAATYTASNGTSAWTNPIVLDAGGRVPGSGEIWLTDNLQYKFLLKDSNDVLIATYDNISGINSNFVSFVNQQEIVTATAGQTVFNLGISYQVGTNSLSVFVDGVNQYGPGAQYAYTETDNDTVTFNSGLHAGAEVKFVTSQLQNASVGDASQVTYDPPFTGSVITNVEDKLAQIVSVKDFGAVGDGVADDTAAIQTAINVAGDNGYLQWPEGSYKVTSTLVQNFNRQRWVGAGRGTTQINFAPTSADTCVEFGSASGLKVFGSISDIGFYSSDSTHKKIAIDLIDVDIFSIDRVTIQGGVVIDGTNMWSGGTSVGLRVRGRDMISVNDLYVAADQPIQFSDNPTGTTTIDIDNSVFRDLYLIANANPCVLMDSGINITQVTFTGRQSWNKGTSGFKWADTGTSIVGNGLVFENVRTEQGTDPTAYSFDIAHNYTLQNLAFRNCYFDLTRKGVRLRKCEDVLLQQTNYYGTGEAYNVDSTVKRVTFDTAVWQAGSTAVISGQRVLWSSPLSPSTAPLSSNALYDEAANTAKTATSDVAVSQTKFSIANAAAVSLGSDLRGTLSVVTSEGFAAAYLMHGTQNLVDVMWQPASTANSFFSNVASTALKVNVYWSAANSRYEIQNLRGAAIDVRINLAGTYGAL